jgi:CRISPR-associated endonuclease/helicase Cas3
MDFNRCFEKLTGHPPLCWQKRLYEHLLGPDDGRPDGLPQALDLPTGLGKTSVMAIWYLALRAGARLPRRLVYVVDRRAVVDQATTIADAIKEKSGDCGLRVSTLRGQHVDNRAWLDNPAAPAIIVGTVDMIGSRLLFEGYGVSRKMRPYQAGLLGADTLVVLDESHLVPPFERLLRKIAERGNLGPRDERDRRLIPSFQLLALSATGRDAGGDVFRLTEEDCRDPIVAQRLTATKRMIFAPADEVKLEERLAEKMNLEARLVVEIDGESHVRRPEHDRARTARLEGRGYRVLRFWKTDVLENVQGVAADIVRALGED